MAKYRFVETRGKKKVLFNPKIIPLVPKRGEKLPHIGNVGEREVLIPLLHFSGGKRRKRASFSWKAALLPTEDNICRCHAGGGERGRKLDFPSSSQKRTAIRFYAKKIRRRGRFLFSRKEKIAGSSAVWHRREG